MNLINRSQTSMEHAASAAGSSLAIVSRDGSATGVSRPNPISAMTATEDRKARLWQEGHDDALRGVSTNPYDKEVIQ